MATYFRITRNTARTQTDEAPYKENLIPKGNGGHKETGNKEESDRDTVTPRVRLAAHRVP